LFLKDLISDEPHLFLNRYMHKYGPVFRLKLIKEIYVINHPDHAKEILKKVHKQIGKKNFIMERMKKVFGNGIVVSEDELWLQERRILMPSFHKQKVTTYLDDIETVKNEYFRNWASNGSIELDLTYEFRRMILRIMMRTLISFDDSELAEKILIIMEKGADLISNSLPFNTPSWVPGSKTHQLEKMNSELEELIEQIFVEHNDKIINNEAGMLSDLHFATDGEGKPIGHRQMIDEVKSILLSGVFTTSDSILWTISHIETHTNIKKELISKLGTQEGDNLLNNIINESTRLFPPVWSLWYNTRAEVDINGSYIPKNAVILINMYNIMRNPKVFENPNTFNPSRFDDPEFPMESFLPYGYGARKCIGANLASFIIPSILRSFYRSFEIHSAMKLPMKARVMITLTNTQEVKVKVENKDHVNYSPQ
jgi:cytochrome P450